MNETLERSSAARPAGGDPSVLEARFAHRVVARLDDTLNRLPPGVDERLRFARSQALTKARARVRAVANADSVVARGVAARRGGPPLWQRTGGWVAMLLVVIGLWAIDQYQAQRRLQNAVDIDARLLTDVLPPSAYADPGFEAFLAQDVQR
jgi:hypothetical protein